MMHNKLLLNHIEIKKVKIEVRILFSQHSSINVREREREKEIMEINPLPRILYIKGDINSNYLRSGA